MTEYWVSRTKHWCEYCKVWIYDNKVSVSNHEMGLNHQKNVQERLAQMRKDSAAAAKQKEQTLRDMDLIEKAARRQYEKDLAEMQAAATGGSSGLAEAEPPAPTAPSIPAMPPPAEPPPPQPQDESIAAPAADEWVVDKASGYHFNAATGYYYDANSGLYYCDILGKWTTQEEAYRASKQAAEDTTVTAAVEQPAEDGAMVSPIGPPSSSPPPQSATQATPTPPVTSTSAPTAPPVTAAHVPPGTGISVPTVTATRVTASVAQARNASGGVAAGGGPKVGGPAPGPVRSSATGPSKARGVSSSLDVAGKRKREVAAGPQTAAELAAIEAREAAKKRQMERERKFMGLY